MGAMGDFPEQLPGENNKAYGHCCAWLHSPAADNTDDFAAQRGISPQYVRQMRSQYDWSNRRLPVVAELQARTSELAVEKVAQSRADKIAAAVERNETAHVLLQSRVLEQALEAATQIPQGAMSAGEIVQLLRVALQHGVRPAERGTAVQVTTDTSGAVDVRVAALEGLPAPEQAARAREIADEATRKISVVEAYYQRQGAA